MNIKETDNIGVRYDLIDVIGKIDDTAWWIKSPDSCITYGNGALIRLLELPSSYNIEGRYDADLPSQVSEFSTDLIIQDQSIIETKSRKVSLDVFKLGGTGEITALLTEKMPIFDENGEVSCILCRTSEITKIPFPTGPEQFLLSSPSDFFSCLEWEVIYLLQKRLPGKMVARVLKISPNKIRKTVEIIYQKCGVSSTNQLIDFVKNQNWHNYIPEIFIKFGVNNLT